MPARRRARRYDPLRPERRICRRRRRVRCWSPVDWRRRQGRRTRGTLLRNRDELYRYADTVDSEIHMRLGQCNTLRRLSPEDVLGWSHADQVAAADSLDTFTHETSTRSHPTRTRQRRSAERAGTSQDGSAARCDARRGCPPRRVVSQRRLSRPRQRVSRRLLGVGRPCCAGPHPTARPPEGTFNRQALVASTASSTSTLRSLC